jgi:hypothetical protein
LQVEALHIILSTIFGASTVQGNELVSQNVVAGGKGGRNLNQPAVIVGNQLIITPDSRDSSVIHETYAINFEELQCRFVNGFARVTTVGEIVNDWAMVRVGPRRPLEIDLVSGRYHGMTLGIGCIKVADDIRCSVVI